MISGNAPVLWHPPPSSSGQGTVLVDISSDDPEWGAVEEEMQSTIREHRDQGHAGGIFSSYRIYKIQKIRWVESWQTRTGKEKNILFISNQSKVQTKLFIIVLNCLFNGGWAVLDTLCSLTVNQVIKKK